MKPPNLSEARIAGLNVWFLLALAVVIAGALFLLMPDDQLLGWVPFAPRLTDWIERLRARPIVGSFDTTEAVPVADLVAFRWIVLGLFAAGLTALRARRG
jgi:hypothetical protein